MRPQEQTDRPATELPASDRGPSGVRDLDDLNRRQRRDLRHLLVRATAAASRPDSNRQDLLTVAGAAPIRALPAAAALHRLGGTVLRGLRDVEDIPVEVTKELNTQRWHSAIRHLLLSDALVEIGRVFDDAGLSWIAMKGPIIAQLYPDVGDRTYGDLDLLVARREFGAAMQILEDMGFEHSIHDWARAESMLAGQVPMSRGLVDVDLHWHLHFSRQDRRQFALDPEDMIARRQRATLPRAEVPVLDAVDRLIALAFHAARSDGHRLVWLKDIERAHTVQQPDLDELVRRCRSYRCGAPVGLMLERSRSLLGTEIPHDVVRTLTPMPLRVTDRVAGSIVHPIQLHERPTSTRLITRSFRSTVAATIADIPARAGRSVERHVRRPPWNETDDAIEKARYVRAVVESVDR